MVVVRVVAVAVLVRVVAVSVVAGRKVMVVPSSAGSEDTGWTAPQVRMDTRYGLYSFRNLS